MKIYISVDLEGICGTTGWDEVTRGKEEYSEFQEQMTAEVCAACEGAFAAGANDIIIRDAHDTARNLIAHKLPEDTTLIRGWSGHPYMMMQELDASFDAVVMIGYHSFAGGAGSSLSHTMNSKVPRFLINDVITSEFTINSFTAARENVPVAFIAGDMEICEHATAMIPSIETVAVKKGVGDSSINIHPKTATERIQEGVVRSLSGDISRHLLSLPETFEISITFGHPKDAYRASFYPGAKLTETNKVTFMMTDYFDVLRMILFTLNW